MDRSGSRDVSIILPAACSDTTQHGMNIEKKDNFRRTHTKNPVEEMLITDLNNKASNKKKSSLARRVLNKVMKIKVSMTRRVKSRKTADTEFCYEDDKEYYQQEFTMTQMTMDNEWIDLCTDFEIFPSDEFWDITSKDCLTETASEYGEFWEITDRDSSTEAPPGENEFCTIANRDSPTETKYKRPNKLGSKLFRNFLCCACKTTR